MCSQNDHPPYTSTIRTIALRRDEGTVLVFRGVDEATSENVEFAADRRPGSVLVDAIDQGQYPLAEVESWQVLLRWRQPVVRGAHL